MNIEVVCRGGQVVNVIGASLDVETLLLTLRVSPTTAFSDQPEGVLIPLPLFDANFEGCPALTQENWPAIRNLIEARIPFIVQLYYGA